MALSVTLCGVNLQVYTSLDHDGFPLYLLTPVDELDEDGIHWGHGSQSDFDIGQLTLLTVYHFTTEKTLKIVADFTLSVCLKYKSIFVKVGRPEYK